MFVFLSAVISLKNLQIFFGSENLDDRVNRYAHNGYCSINQNRPDFLSSIDRVLFHTFPLRSSEKKDNASKLKPNIASRVSIGSRFCFVLFRFFVFVGQREKGESEAENAIKANSSD